MDYVPNPIDTSKVSMPEELIELIEALAEDAHDTWAKQRMKEGWTYGKERNDSEKKHPCLVPYENLPDSEKEYDRIMAVQIVKTIMSKGYSISKG